MTNEFSQLLDSDWARLNMLAGLPSCQRRLMHSFTIRFAPVTLVRFAQILHAKGWPRLAKLPTMVNFVLFGIEVSPRIPIGPGLVLPHTQGTVIGAWRIGSNATIFHGVTLGAKEIDFTYSEKSRPKVGDGVTIGSGAKVLGGITLGDSVRVGANSVVLSDIPEGALAVGVPASVKKLNELLR